MILLILIFLPSVVASPPSSILDAPPDGNVSMSSQEFLSCTGTDDEDVYSATLYTTINGSFLPFNTTSYKESERDQNTTVLCRFNNTYTCVTGETGTNTSTDFVSSPFLEGVRVNASDTLVYSTATNVLFIQGTIEFWIQFGFDPANDEVYLFSTGSDTMNGIDIRTESGELIFDLWDDGNLPHEVTKDISSLAQGTWHHIAVVWNTNAPLANGHFVDLFIDGSNASTNFDEQFDTGGTFDASFFLGSRGGGTSQSNSVFDELRIFNSTRSQQHINDSYNKGSATRTSATANWTITAIPDGTYLWNCLIQDNESQTTFNTSNRTFSIDVASAPTVRTITLSPSDENDIDPNTNVSITANITDPSNVSTVIFQWKETGDWTNDSMDFNNGTGVWENATIPIDPTGGVYQYRVWANDSNGFANYTAAQNITASFDYTWNLTPSSFGTVSGQINTVQFIGNLNINNTGDDLLQFNITDDWPFTVLYNGSESPSYQIPANSSLNISVNVTFAAQNEERNLTFTVSASHASETPSPTTATSLATINSFTGGPFLTIDLVTVPASIEQGGSANITASVKNIGNETVQNTTLNWSLPVGWSNTSGNAILVIGTMSSQQTNLSTIQVFLDSASASSGISQLCVNATGSGNANATDCENIGVSCSNTDGICGLGCTFNNDNDCPAGGSSSSGSSGGSPSGGGALVISETFSLDLQVPETLTAFRGESLTFIVRVENGEPDTNLDDITIHVAGHPKTLTQVTPVSSALAYAEEADFTVLLDIPDYLPYGPVPLTITATALGSHAGYTAAGITDVEVSHDAVLIITSRSEEEARALMETAATSLQQLDAAGFSTADLAVLLQNAERALTTFDFEQARQNAETIISTAEKITTVHDLLQTLRANLDTAASLGIASQEVENLYTLANAAFSRGDYDRAEERTTTALLTYSLQISGQVVTARFFHTYGGALAGGLVVLLISILITRRQLTAAFLKHRILSLNKEEQTIKRLISQLQSRSFQEQNISKDEYTLALHDYQKRLAAIDTERSRLKSQRVALLRVGHTHQDLAKQRTHLKRLLRETQREYFEQRTLGKSAYEIRMHSLKKELAEIEKSLTKKKYFVLVLLPLLVLSPVDAQDLPPVFAQAEQQIAEIAVLGYGTARMNDTYQEALVLHEEGDTVLAESLARFVLSLGSMAREADALIDEVEVSLVVLESEEDVPDARSLFNQALIAFEEERFEEARDLLLQSRNVIEDVRERALLEETSLQAEQQSYISFLYSSWPLIAMAILVLGFVSILAVLVTKKHRRLRAIRSLTREKRAIERSMRTLQRRYFDDHSLSKKEYHDTLTQFEQQLHRIQKNLILLEHNQDIGDV